jgi:hypothetical protein
MLLADYTTAPRRHCRNAVSLWFEMIWVACHSFGFFEVAWAYFSRTPKEHLLEAFRPYSSSTVYLRTDSDQPRSLSCTLGRPRKLIGESHKISYALAFQSSGRGRIPAHVRTPTKYDCFTLTPAFNSELFDRPSMRRESCGNL